MLPESAAAKQAYIEMRDMRSSHRQMMLRTLHGDLDEFNAYVLEHVAIDAELSDFRESFDFAKDEGILTAEMIHAAESAISWGIEAKRLIEEHLKARAA